ncbi:MAG: [FeFe] hydrogenase H-cluster maturation GTPase HydF [Spirochaetales bacterium]|nr:[FeFe] hydrogenase H-cluster maturation GTPase HydF [Spirochaetales bacterium]
MTQTPLSERLRVVFAGPMNAGKSSLMNALFGREAALVSDTPGTTTDPVTRCFEIPGLGPAAITDTPGIDDSGELGEQRVRLALNKAAEADIRVFITPQHRSPGEAEKALYSSWFMPQDSPENSASEKANKPAILVLTHGDEPPHPEKEAWAQASGALRTEAPSGRGIPALVAAIAAAKPEREMAPLDGLVGEGDTVLMVTPIDLAAPAGRLIGPQVQSIRDALDKDAISVVVKERELRSAYANLRQPPKLVVTDSQAFSKVAADIPEHQLLTSFSILYARKKGDLGQFLQGLAAAVATPDAPEILILESCAHHRQADDIGTVKIPRLFRQMLRDDANFSFYKGMPEPQELSKFHLVIHCGACRLTRGAMGHRLDLLKQSGVPVTNYGMFLAWANGLMPRALEPFEDAMEIWKKLQKSASSQG